MTPFGKSKIPKTIKTPILRASRRIPGSTGTSQNPSRRAFARTSDVFAMYPTQKTCRNTRRHPLRTMKRRPDHDASGLFLLCYGNEKMVVDCANSGGGYGGRLRNGFREGGKWVFSPFGFGELGDLPRGRVFTVRATVSSDRQHKRTEQCGRL